MLTPKEFAGKFDVTYGAVLIWIRKGQLKAERHETLRGPAYLIPASEINRFKPPKAGRPRKVQPEKKSTAKK